MSENRPKIDINRKFYSNIWKNLPKTLNIFKKFSNVSKKREISKFVIEKGFEMSKTGKTKIVLS